MTPSDLYAMGMESSLAYKLMEQLCKALNTPYPPKADDLTPLLAQTAPALNLGE